MRPPVAAKVPHVWSRPTGPVDDPWAWLRNRDDPATIAYLAAENAYSDAWFSANGRLVDQLFDEIRSRVQEDDRSPPVHHGTWWYVTRTAQGRSYPIHCRGTTPERATDLVLLDENVEAEGHEYFALHAFDVDPTHRLLAWSADTDGSEHYTLRVRDLATGTDLADVITDTAPGGTAWAADSASVFYVTADDQERPSTVWRHRLGTRQRDDVRVFHESDARFHVTIGLTRSRRWIVIESSSTTSSEAVVIAADLPDSDALVIAPRRENVEYSVDHWGDRWVVLTNLDAVDFRVMTAPLDRPSDWTELVPGGVGRRITSIDAFAEHLVVHEWADAQPRLRILFRDGGERLVDLGAEPHDVELDANPEYTTDVVRYTHQSSTSPVAVLEETVGRASPPVRRALKQVTVPGVDLRDYVASRTWATAPDGARIPVDIAHHRDVRPDGTAPLVVYGYGSYEASLPPWFSVARLSLLDRGVVWALVHPRGGGELGRQWYLDGRLRRKRATFTDTLACVDHLIAAGWADPGRVAIRGASAGGLLVGACVTMRPSAFRAAVAEVPFVDVVTTMSDTTLPLTVTEWEEWGDPRQADDAAYIASYSPYDNTGPAHYPALLVTAGLNDPRVSFHEPAKWVARLREASTGDRVTLLRTEMGAGHGGPSGRYDAWREEARVLAFLLVELGAEA